MPTTTSTYSYSRSPGWNGRAAALLLMLALAFSALTPTAGLAQDSQRCFVETGYCISGPIRDYWEHNGGLPVFGYPLSEQRIEVVEGAWRGRVQWFERDRLEDHGTDGVLAGRLGDRALQLRGIDWQQLPRDGAATPGCRFFPETQLNVCQPFLGYWEQGGGLARFGFPITGVRQERLEGGTYAVQYFERRRMEHHPENAGTLYEVLLGLLGRDVLNSEACSTIGVELRATWETLARDLGCGQPFGDGSIAAQPFERGAMVWVGRGDGSPGLIFVLTTLPAVDLTWNIFIDTYREGELVGTNESPPPGKYAPLRGFGKLWRTVPELRQSLGWALSPEVGDQGTVLQFGHPNGFQWMIHRRSTDMVYILRVFPPANRAVDVSRVNP
jgi:hypothetical protein